MANTYTKISTTTVGAGGASSIVFSNIPATYTDLVVRLSVRSTGSQVYGEGTLLMSINGDTTAANYTYRQIWGTGSGSGGNAGNNYFAGITQGGGMTAGIFAATDLHIADYNNANILKNYLSDGAEEAAATNSIMNMLATIWYNSSPITSLTLRDATNNFAEHTVVTLYGVFNADVSSAPATPTIGTATSGDERALVSFTEVSNAASYEITSSPGNITATGTSSPILVTGLTNNTSYTFTVKSKNPFGTSSASSASNSVTPGTAFESIASVTLGSATNTITFSGISGSYTHLQLHYNLRASKAVNDNGVFITFNGDTGSNYNTSYVQGATSSVSTGGSANASYLYTACVGANASGNYRSAGVMEIPDYSNTNKNKSAFLMTTIPINTSNANFLVTAGAWRNTSAITSITFTSEPTSNFITDSSIELYGIRSM
jgi:chitodextrinase